MTIASADEWIREAKSAGMRYFLITAKHHDGFCLWQTGAANWLAVKWLVMFQNAT